MKKIVFILIVLLLMTGCEEKKEQEFPSDNNYAISIEGVDVKVGEEFQKVQSHLGEDFTTQKAKSCAFEGEDHIYTYPDYEIYNYVENDVEKIYTITLLTDKVSTKEGIHLGSTKEEVEETYGNDYEDSYGAYVYSKGNTVLTFIFEEEKVISIEYKLNQEGK